MKHEKKEIREKRSNDFFSDPWKVGLSLLVIVLLAYIVVNSGGGNKPPAGNNQTSNQTGNQTVEKKASVTLELYVMSQCPYGVQAEQMAKNVIDTFGGDVNLSLSFIANQNPDGTFTSLHGQPEVEEDLRQVCIMKYYPQKLVGYLSCIADNYTKAGQIWESCASQNQIDSGIIGGCSSGTEGSQLLSNNIAKTSQLQISSSPTIYLNGTRYGGARDENSMTRSICTLIPGSNTCKNLPPEVSVQLIEINDEDCLLCDTQGIESSLSGMIYSLKIKKLNYTSAEGIALLQKFNITGIPAYIFDSSIVQHSSYASLSRYLQKADSYYLLLVQPVKLLGRVEENNTLQLYVMSQCPYGTMAENATKELLDAMPQVKFAGLRFIATENANGTFTSLHGQPEVEEDLRQVCIMKYYPQKLFDYVLCIAADYRNAGSIWEGCANSSGIDSAKIRNCSSSDEGKALLKENIAPSNSIGIYSSPTLLLNNDTLFNSVSAEEMKQIVCGYNPALTGCNKTLSGQATTGTPSGGCG